MKYFWARSKRRVSDFTWAIRYWRQRRAWGYDAREVIDFQHYCAKWMLPRLKHFRKDTQGYPLELDPCWSRADSDGSCICPDKDAAFNRWLEIIDEMIFACQFTIDDDDTDKYHGDIEGWKAAQARARDGYKLLGEYFQGLWL